MLPGLLFAGIPDDIHAALRRACAVRSYAAGETLFHEEDRARLLMLVLEGSVRVWRSSSPGGIMTVHLMGPGALPGCAAAFRQRSYPASATALTAARVATWRMETILALMDDCPLLATNALGVVSGYTEEMLERLHEVSTQSVEQRLAGTILRLLGIDNARAGEPPEIELSRQALAELAATTLHTVSRFISCWHRQGIVRAGRKRVAILRPAALAAICRGA